jgi:hypothetical protein
MKGDPMNPQRPGILVPVLIGGAAAGFLSGLPVFGCLCCLWPIGGAMLSVFLLAKETPHSLTPGDGAIVGAFAGIAAAVVSALVEIPLKTMNEEFLRTVLSRLAEFTEDLPAGWETWLDESTQLSLPLFLIGLFVSALIYAGLGALGGILGVSLFGKKPSQPAAVPDASQDPGYRQP